MRESEEMEDFVDYRPVASAFHGATVVLHVGAVRSSGHQVGTAFRLRANKGDNLIPHLLTTVTASQALRSPSADFDHRLAELFFDPHR